jgi:V/A-type H+/Na+-transporting ATPase subunit I
MALVSMQKVEIITLLSYKKTVLKYLQQQEVFELESNENSNESDLEELRSFEKNMADIEFVLRFLKGYNKESTPFSHALMGEKEVFSESSLSEIVAQYDFQKIVQQVQDIERAVTYSKSLISDIEKKQEVLSYVSNASIDFNEIKNQSSVSVFFGTINTPHYLFFKEELEKSMKEISLEEIQSNENQTSFCVIYLKEVKDAFFTHMKKHEITEVIIPEDCIYIKDTLQELEGSLKKQKLQLLDLQSQAEVLCKELPKLKGCYDYFLWKKENAVVGMQGVYSNYTVTFKGWIKEKMLETLEFELSQITEQSVGIVRLDTAEDENVPVEIENKSIVAPFEVITRMYGLPKTSELDPTPYLAVFFLVFFGFCLTDTLYGLLLASVCIAVLRYMKVPREMKGFFMLLAACGVSTTVLGLIFGGYAGIPVEHFPSFLQNLQVFDTTNSEDILKIMTITFGLGAFQLWFGTLVAGFHALKSKKRMTAFCEHFSWTFALVLLGLGYAVNGNEQLFMNVVLPIFAFLSICFSYKTKNIFLKLIVGPFMLIQELIAWGSNILSYARLFALGLATGVIAMVFNEIGMIISSMLPVYIGIPIMIFIILFGHTLNVAINILGAFIHSARLQFVEFFGKFLEGGGRQFRPFKRDSMYVYLEK